jgi:hypothetical protein
MGDDRIDGRLENRLEMGDGRWEIKFLVLVL